LPKYVGKGIFCFVDFKSGKTDLNRLVEKLSKAFKAPQDAQSSFNKDDDALELSKQEPRFTFVRKSAESDAELCPKAEESERKL